MLALCPTSLFVKRVPFNSRDCPLSASQGFTLYITGYPESSQPKNTGDPICVTEALDDVLGTGTEITN